MHAVDEIAAIVVLLARLVHTTNVIMRMEAVVPLAAPPSY